MTFVRSLVGNVVGITDKQVDSQTQANGRQTLRLKDRRTDMTWTDRDRQSKTVAFSALNIASHLLFQGQDFSLVTVFCVGD